MSPQELLSRLQEQVRISEVISGFHATQDPSLSSMGVMDMSIADGIQGSFHLSQWEATFLHGVNFSEAGKSFYQASCGRNGEAISWKYFGYQGCASKAEREYSWRDGQCGIEPFTNSTIRLRCVNGMLFEEIWSPKPHANGALSRNARGSLRDSPSPFRPVSCPHAAPDTNLSYIADGGCHEQSGNTSFNYWQLEDDAEVHLYGLRPMKVPGVPKTFDDVAERATYCLVNDALIDAGSPIFGQVSSVFSQSAAHRMMILSAIDTGSWESFCNRSLMKNMSTVNCSAYLPFVHLGTMEHFNHLFLINEQFWTGKNTLAYRFKRLEGSWGSHPFTGKNLLSYFEAIPLGPLLFPGDVRFLIGDFPELFGTSEGAMLRKWAMQRRWVLIWTLGLNLGNTSMFGPNPIVLAGDKAFSGNQRLVDPVVAFESSAQSDLPLSEAVRKDFQQQWEKAEELRAQAGGTSNVTWASQWSEVASAMPSDLRVRPLRAGDCPRKAGAPECIGTSGSGKCVCYANKGEQALLNQEHDVLVV